jgi:hypothetical protein
MGEPSDNDTDALRTRARERIEQGRLPCAKALRTWGGLGSGLRCDLCDSPISSSEPEFELQLDLAESAGSVRFHRQCHAIWNEVRESWRAGGWRVIAREPPPFGATIEARVKLAETRTIILSVTCLGEPASGGPWINATTGGPLPEGWRPIEWRPLPHESAGAHPGAGAPGTARSAAPDANARAPAASGRAVEPTAPSAAETSLRRAER